MEKKDVLCNTTGSMYVTSLITAPNVKSIIQAVATILHSQLSEDSNSSKDIPKGSDMYFFSEEKYIDEKPE